MKRFRRAMLAVGAAALALSPMVATPIADAAPKAAVGGGTGIVIDGRALCSLTAVGHDRAGRLVGLTAGHCGGLGSRISIEKKRGLGQVGRIMTRSSKYDFAVIQLDSSRVRGVRSVGGATITGVAAYPQPFTVVCKAGRTTGFSCGPTLQFNGQYAYSYVCSAPGDSGGPVILGRKLVGMLNGGLRIAGPGTSIPCANPQIPLHTPMVATKMTDILRVLNGVDAVGSGFRPV